MNKYEILRSVGEGAYGTVYKCRNLETGETVAIKKFKECEEDDIVKKTTLREVKILRMLRHDNIVQLKEAFRRKGKLYLVFEFVDKNLLEVLTELYPHGLDPELVRSTVLQVIRAIEYCHRHDVIHRDIKPENLLVNLADMSVKLCDFGFARVLPIGHQKELTDYVATRWYRAPELLLGSLRYGPPVDLFAIGCIMGEVADGEPLLPGESEVDQLSLIQRVISPLSMDQLDQFSSNPRFVGMQIPTIPFRGNGVLPYQRRFVGRFSKRGLLLMGALLEVEAGERVTAEQALRDPYFSGILTKSRHESDSRRPSRPATVLSHGRKFGLPPKPHEESRQSSTDSLLSLGRGSRGFQGPPSSQPPTNGSLRLKEFNFFREATGARVIHPINAFPPSAVRHNHANLHEKR